MAFRASNVVPQEAYRMAKGAAVNIKRHCQSYNTKMAASGADYELLRAIARTLRDGGNQLSELSGTPGLAAYAQAQEDDGSYDVVAEFLALQSAISAAIAWLDANVPTSVTVQPPSAWDNGPLVIETFTPPQTEGLRSALSAVINAID